MTQEASQLNLQQSSSSSRSVGESTLRDLASLAAASDIPSVRGSDSLVGVGGGWIDPGYGVPVLAPLSPGRRPRRLCWAMAAAGVLLGISLAVGGTALAIRGKSAAPRAEQVAQGIPSLDGQQAPAVAAVAGTDPAARGAEPISEVADGEPEAAAGHPSPSGPAAQPATSRQSRAAAKARVAPASAPRIVPQAPGQAEASPEAPAPPAEQPAAPAPRPTRPTLDQLIDDALDPSADETSSPDPSVASGVPQSLTRAQVSSALRAVAPAARRCGQGERRTVRVNLIVNGGSGRVTSAQVVGDDAATATGSCVSRAAQRASFPRFDDDQLRINGFPFIVQ